MRGTKQDAQNKADSYGVVQNNERRGTSDQPSRGTNQHGSVVQQTDRGTNAVVQNAASLPVVQSVIRGTKTEVIRVRVTPKQETQLRELAWSRGTNVSELVRMLIEAACAGSSVVQVVVQNGDLSGLDEL